MGRDARQNATAQDAASGKLLSRGTIIGAMDQALENHAAALRILEARIKATNERVDALEAQWKTPAQ